MTNYSLFAELRVLWQTVQRPGDHEAVAPGRLGVVAGGDHVVRQRGAHVDDAVYNVDHGASFFQMHTNDDVLFLCHIRGVQR